VTNDDRIEVCHHALWVVTAMAHWERSRAHYGLNDRVKGKADYAQALKLDPQVGKQ
jgi:hypothetical protein